MKTTGTDSIREQSEYYDRRWSDEYSKPINELQLQRLISVLQMLSKIKLNQQVKLLDLGCGTGWMTSILSHMGQVTGLELSREAVRAAKIKYPHIDFFDGDLFEVLKETGKFDIVVSQEVIEHVEDQKLFIDQVAESLVEGGHFIFTTPNAWTQAHRTEKEHAEWALQPIENWIDRNDIKRLMKDKFEIFEIKSIIFGFGTTGIFRIINSYKLKTILETMGLYNIFQKAALKFDCGLHLIVHAIKK